MIRFKAVTLHEDTSLRKIKNFHFRFFLLTCFKNLCKHRRDGSPGFFSIFFHKLLSEDHGFLSKILRGEVWPVLTIYCAVYIFTLDVLRSEERIHEYFEIFLMFLIRLGCTMHKRSWHSTLKYLRIKFSSGNYLPSSRMSWAIGEAGGAVSVTHGQVEWDQTLRSLFSRGRADAGFSRVWGYHN